jgi:hypothetical protein
MALIGHDSHVYNCPLWSAANSKIAPTTAIPKMQKQIRHTPQKAVPIIVTYPAAAKPILSQNPPCYRLSHERSGLL